MEWVKLGDVVDIKTGKLNANAANEKGRYPFFTTSDETLRIDSFSYDEEAVLVAGNGNLNVKYYKGKFDAYQRTYILTDKYTANLNMKYIFFFLDSYLDRLRFQSIGGVIKYIKLENLTDANLILPDLNIQNSIVKILEASKTLISTRKAQITALDELVQSLFYEMFGNSKFIHYSFSELVKIDTKTINDFTSLKDEFYIGVENIEKNTGNLIDFIKVGDADIKSSKNLFNENHILYSKIRPNLNKVAIPNFSGVTSTDIFPLLPSSKINKMYLTQILRGKTFLDYAILNSSGANIPRINKTILNNFQIPLPPLELQEQFAAKVEAIEAQKAKLQASLEEMETLFDALMQEAFSGNLG